MKLPRITGTAQAAIGALMLLILALPLVREVLEQSMQLHMLLQYPLIMLAGALLAQAVPHAMARTLSAWNTMGFTGLAAALLFTTVLMIPRVLDLVLIDLGAEITKFSALLLVGAMLPASWRSAGVVVQAFFLGSILPMTIVVGTLYQSAPIRLCNAYRLEDQQALGHGLVYIAVAVAAIWLVHTARRVIGAEVEEEPAR